MRSAVDTTIDTLQSSGTLAGRTLYAFGHTAATEELRRRLRRDGLRLAAILDNNALKQGSLLGDVPIIAPESISAGRDPSLVLIASRFYDAMRRQLLDLGYPGESILRVGEFTVSADGNATRGRQLLQRLRRAHAGRHLVLCPFGAFGDVYWALSYLPAFVATAQLQPVVPVLVGASYRQVAQLFGYVEGESLSQADMDDLLAAVVATQPADVTIAHHDRPYARTAPVRALDDRFIRFSELYRDVVYGLSDRVVPEPPRFRPDRRPLPDGLIPGRSVLLAPYAKSVLPVTSSFWTDAATHYASQGYAVATLIHGEEKPISGTLALTVEIPDLLHLTECAGTFIALRSGLCDIVHTARARKVHVLPDAYYSTTRHKVADFFALPGWESIVLPVS